MAILSPTLTTGSIAERARAHQVLIEWNDRASGYPRDATIPDLVSAIAEAAPDRTALVHGGAHLSYGELRRRAAALAGHLRSLGVGRRGAETPVAVALDRSPELVVTLLAILEAGGFYVPLDPSYPPARLCHMIETSGAGLAVTDSRNAAALPLDGLATVLLDRPPAAPAAPAEGEPAASASAAPGRLAYVLFTSGSTGEPKGVAVTHRNVVRLVREPDFARLDGDETILLLAPISFDASTLELWGALANGGRLEIVEAAKPSLDELTETVERGRVTTLWLTAGLFHQVVDHRIDRLRGARRLLAGGDVLSPDHVRRALAALPDTAVVNGYGPTENTTFTTTFPMRACATPEPALAGSVPIGRPIADTRVYLLDDDLEPVPPGVEGELYAAGDGLARGYRSRPGLTAERFVPAPRATGEEPGARLYKTGDRARWRPDGTIEFRGRRDGQVKLRGFRIETGEIESALHRHPAVRQAVVVLREAAAGRQGGDARLVAYLVPPSGRELTADDLAELRTDLGSRLPDYMVPSAFVTLPELPLDPNGKLDRRRLPEPAADRAHLPAAYVPPATPTETAVARALGELCAVHPVGAGDHFLELGGHSLLATRLVARIDAELGVPLALGDLLGDPTVSELARQIDALGGGPRDAGLPPIAPVPRGGPLPLAPSAERVWFLLELDRSNLAYQFQASLRFAGPLDRRALRRALDAVIARHEAFRTTFPERGGVPVQVIHPPAPAHVTDVDLSGLARISHQGPQRNGADGCSSKARDRRATQAYLAVRRGARPSATPEMRPDAPLQPEAGEKSGLAPRARAAARQALVTAALARAFDARRLPLVRWILVRLAPDDHLLLHLEHHLVHDGWSFHVFLQDLSAGYRAALAGDAVVLPPLAIQFADVAAWQRAWLASPEAERQRRYWRQRLTPPPPPLELPWDRPRPPRQTYRGAAPRTILPATLGDALREAGRRTGATLYMVMLAGFHALLARYTGARDVATGCGIANRRHPETERLVGMLVNNVVLRTELGVDPSFRELLGRVRTTTLEAYEHQDLPFDAVVEAVRPPRDPSYNPLFQAMFSFHDSPLGEVVWPGLEVDVTVGLSNGTAKFDLNVIGIPGAEQRLARGKGADDVGGGEIEMVWEHNTDLFDPATVARMIGHYRTLLAAAAADPDAPVAALPLLSAAEAQQVRAEWNDRASGYPREASIPELFAEVAEAAPERTALACGAVHVSYGELRRRSLALAARLSARGAGAETAVAVALDRSPELVVALLAILEAGGFYVPLDPSYPEARLARMIETAGARLAVTDTRLAEALPLDGVETLLLDGPAAPDAAGAAEATGPTGGMGADTLAYVLFTSGSTGEPKGVAVPHRAVARLVREADFARLDVEETLLLLAPVSFDASTLELWGALLNGGRLEIAAAAKPSLDELAETIERGRVTTAWLTAGLFHQMVEERLDRLSGLCQLLAGGDVLSPEHVRRALDGLPGTTVINGYGPTENTTFTTCFPMRADTALPATVPVGRPIADSRVHLLDDDLRPAPAGVEAELYAGGDGLARGYRGRPALTAERFVPAPTATGEPPGSRLYRTGDRARWRPDGTIEFRGRRDGQVKLRGFRIETGEIESALTEHPSVRQAVVVLRPDLAGGGLVAYLVPEERAEPAAAPRDLRDHLAARLPDYMVPSAFVTLPELPLDPNGKVDRRALPAPTVDEAGSRREEDRGGSPVQELLAAIWADVLGRERVPAGADFFDLGGHSLLATRVASRIRDAFGVALPLAALFEEPTLDGLAGRIEAALSAGTGSAEAPPIEPGPLTGEHPLSFAQERIWLLDQLDPAATMFNTLHSLELAGRLDAPALGRALARLAERHAVLRTAFPSHDGRPAQAIAEPRGLPMPVVDLQALPATARRAELARRQRDDARVPFDLERAPLVRLRLLRLRSKGGTEEHVLLLCIHHLVADGWSLGVLLRELAALYRHEAGGEAPSAAELPALPVQYADFARWQRVHLESHERQVEYWRGRLAEPTLQDLPTDRPRGDAQTYRGAQHVQHLGADLSGRLAALGRSEGATLFMTLLAAFEALLLRHTGEPDVLVGTPIAGRVRAEVEELIGVFLNTLVLRTDLGGDPAFRELLARVRESALGAYAHQDVPFERLLEELQPERDASRTPYFQVFFNLLNFPERTASVPGLGLRLLRRPDVPAKFDLGLYVRELGGTIEVRWIYDADLFDATTVRRLARQYERALDAASERPDERLSRLPLLPASERHQVLVEWNDSATGTDGERPVHELFFERARRAPGETALVWDGGGRLDYGTLAARAEALTRSLAARGAGPESLVALCLDRSPGLAVAMLAVLRSGASFLPLDPGQPAERLRRMLDDAGAALLVTTEAPLQRLPAWRDHALCLDRSPAPWDGETAHEAPSPAPPDPGNPAYVVYTSGSTGQPKGAVITHRTLALRLAWMQTAYGLAPGERVLHKASPGFDVAIWEVLWPLAAGAAVAIARPDGHKDPAYLRGAIAEHGVSLVHFVPSMLELFVGETDLEACRSLRVVLSGGEALPAELLARARRSLPGALFNQYGMSEGCIDVTWWDASRESPADPVPIGRPYGDTAVHLLGPELHPAPIGAVADLWVGGDDGLLRGYRNDPARTAAAVRPDPFADGGARPGARLYRTGDRARRRPDGVVVYVGRADHQIKLRGLRIAPEEIEHALVAHPAVALAAVVARDQRLVAFLEPDGEPPAPEALRSHLRARLPEALIPSLFVTLDPLPKTASGKLDRRALADRDLGPAEPAPAGGTPPRTPAERLVAEVWKEVLGIAEVSVEDNFFERGGHSLFAAQVVAHLRKDHAVDLPLRHLFQAPDLEALAREVEGRLAERGDDRTPTLAEVAGAASDGAAEAQMTLAQKPFWWGRDVATAPASTLPIVFGLQGALDRPALAAALSAVVARHDVLRTSFAARNGSAVQVVHPARPLPVPSIDLSGLAPERQEAARSLLMPRLIRRGWDLENGPLVSALLFLLGPERHAVAVFTHHILLDGWSSALFMDEIEALYRDHRTADLRRPARPEPPFQYADFARWQERFLAGSAAREHLDYWRERFRGRLDTTGFPTDRTAPAVRSHLARTLLTEIPRPLVGRLRALAAAEGKTLFMVLLAAVKTVLMRHTGRRDVTVLSPYANRQLAETEAMLGSFFTMLPLRTRLATDLGYRDLLDAVQETTLDAYTHAPALPDDLLRRIWAHPEAARDDEPPVSRVLFALQNTAHLNRELGGLRVRVEPYDSGRIRFDTALFVYEGADDLWVRLRYDRDLYGEGTAEGWFREVVDVLRAAVADPGRPQ